MIPSLAKFVEGHARGLVLVCLAFALAGLAFVFQTPVSLFPQTNFPRIVILMDNGIQPVNVQMTTVTKPVEDAIRMVPGDPVEVRTGERGISPERLAQFRHELGLDQPVWKQFLDYAGGLLHGDFGTSVVTNEKVLTEFLKLSGPINPPLRLQGWPGRVERSAISASDQLGQVSSQRYFFYIGPAPEVRI